MRVRVRVRVRVSSGGVSEKRVRVRVRVSNRGDSEKRTARVSRVGVMRNRIVVRVLGRAQEDLESVGGYDLMGAMGMRGGQHLLIRHCCSQKTLEKGKNEGGERETKTLIIVAAFPAQIAARRRRRRRRLPPRPPTPTPTAVVPPAIHVAPRDSWAPSGRGRALVHVARCSAPPLLLSPPPLHLHLHGYAGKKKTLTEL